MRGGASGLDGGAQSGGGFPQDGGTPLQSVEVSPQDGKTSPQNGGTSGGVQNVLFLDIDGVVCSPLSLRLNRLLRRPLERELFDPVAFYWLRWIVRRTGAAVVLSSTWRDGLMMMDDPVFSGILGNLFASMDRNGTPVEDVTPLAMEGDKGSEIAHWLDCTPVERYAVLDDHDCFGSRQEVRQRWVPVPDSRGLRRREAAAVMRLLEG